MAKRFRIKIRLFGGKKKEISTYDVVKEKKERKKVEERKKDKRIFGLFPPLLTDRSAIIIYHFELYLLLFQDSFIDTH